MHQKRSLPDARVLVTGAGSPAAVGFMRGVDREPIELFAADIDPLAQGLYLVPPHRRVLVPQGDDPAFVEAVLATCRSQGIDVLVPTLESELMPLARHAEEFAREDVRLMLPAPETLAVTLDRWETVRRLDGAVPLPETTLLDEEIDEIDLRFPLVARPRTGTEADRSVFAESLADLRELARDGSYMLQALPSGPEFSVDVLRLDGRQIAAVPRERLKVDSGVAVTSRTRCDPQLEEMGATAARAVDLDGVATIPFRITAAGVPQLREIRPLFPNTMALTIAAGVNMPALWLRALLGRGGASEITGFKEIAMVRTLLDQVVPVAELEAMSRSSPEFAPKMAA